MALELAWQASSHDSAILATSGYICPSSSAWTITYLEKLDLLCDHPDHWESNAISMVYLQELELTGFTGTDCELWFIKAMLTSAKSVRKVAISFIRDCFQHQGKMDALERMLIDGGMWTSHRDKHMLTCLRLLGN